MQRTNVINGDPTQNGIYDQNHLCKYPVSLQLQQKRSFKYQHVVMCHAKRSQYNERPIQMLKNALMNSIVIHVKPIFHQESTLRMLAICAKTATKGNGP